MKKKIIITSLAFVAMALGIGSSVYAFAKEGASAVKADTPVTISTLAQLKAYFDGAGTNCGNSATLAADIDLNGAYVSGMAGEFSATFNGNGHRLYNGVVAPEKSLFNIIGTAGVVKNLTLDVTVSGAVLRPVSYQNNGTIQNSTVVIRTGAASVNNVAAYAYLAGNGTYSNLFTDWVVNHAGADWLCSIYRDQSSTNITGCYYTMNGSVGSSANFQADSAASSTDVNYVNAPATADVVVDRTAAFTVEAFGSVNTSVTFASDNTSVATVTNTNNSLTATVSGVAAGTANITCTVVSAKGTFTGKTVVTVKTSAPVTAVSLSAASSSIYKGKTTIVTATLTGTEYDHITWSSSSDATATVAGSGATATVTGVAAGSVTITATVYNSSSAVLASNTCDITVNNPAVIPIYMLESKATTDKSAFASNAYLFPYGEFDSTTIAMTKVTSNSQDVKFRMANTKNRNAMDSWQLWYGEIDISGKTMAYTNAWIQINFFTSGRWGSGYQITSAAGAVFACGYTSADAYVTLAWAQANLKAAVTHSASTIYSGAWRDTNSSICYLSQAANVATLKTYYDSYAALTSNVKTIADAFDDSTTANNATYGETMAMLHKYYPSGSGSNSVQSAEEKSNTALITAIAAMGVLALGAGAFVIARKKQH